MKRFSAIDGVLVSGRRAMIPSTVVSGVVQSLIFLATLKSLGVALDSLALIPGQAFSCTDLPYRSGRRRWDGGDQLHYSTNHWPETRHCPFHAGCRADLRGLQRAHAFPGAFAVDNPLGLAPKSVASYPMAYVSLVIGALVNAGVAMLVVSVGGARARSAEPVR